MKREGKRPGMLWLILLLILAAAALTAYLVMTQENGDAPPAQRTQSRETRNLEAQQTDIQRQPVPRDSKPSSRQEEARPAEAEMPPEEAPPPASTEVAIAQTGEPEDFCAEMEADVRDFFHYLDGKEYTAPYVGDADTWTLFTRALAKLSSHPPIPAGEGQDPALMARNIYHFFRTLGDRELLLAKAVIQHEADTLELNLDLFYRWLTLGDRCPDPEGVRPSQNVLYRYAGFFMNTIGGRSYLFRRSARLRLLVSYYAVLILSDADRAGRNRYGIDVLPLARDLREEIALHPDLFFYETYLDRLAGIEGHYAAHR